MPMWMCDKMWYYLLISCFQLSYIHLLALYLCTGAVLQCGNPTLANNIFHSSEQKHKAFVKTL